MYKVCKMTIEDNKENSKMVSANSMKSCQNAL